MRRRLAIATVLFLTIGTVSVAYAATVAMYPGVGIGGARLGARDSSGVTALKKSFVYSGHILDTDYAQPVIEYRFGRVLLDTRGHSTGHYPVEMYSNKSGRVTTFEVNTPLCVTSKGIRVGSTEAQLKRAYGSALKMQKTPTYSHLPYYLYWTMVVSGRTHNRTDYYVSRTTHKITRVLISRY